MCFRTMFASYKEAIQHLEVDHLVSKSHEMQSSVRDKSTRTPVVDARYAVEILDR